MRTLRSVLGRSPAALIVIFAVCSAACANHAAIEHGNTVAGHLAPVDESDIEIVREHIEVTIEPSKKWTTTPMARVRVGYVLRNPTGRREVLRLAFPVFGWRRPTKGKGPWFQVRVDGRTVNVEQEQLSRTVRTVYADKGRVKSYASLLDDWMDAVPGLAETAAELRETSAKEAALSKVMRGFRDEAKKHLIDTDRGGDVWSFVWKPLDFSAVLRLIADVDPSLRMDVKDGRRPYVSIINEYKIESYRPYEKEWRKRIDDWIAARPRLAELAARARSWRDAQRRKRELSEGLAKLLHDECGLSIQHALKLASYSARREVYKGPPPADVLATLFPQVARDVEVARVAEEKARAEWDDLLARWGKEEFDSPLAKTLRELGRHGSNILSIGGEVWWGTGEWKLPGPTLMKYSLSMKPGAESVLAVDYSTLLSYDDALYMSHSHSYVLPYFNYVLKTSRHWKSFGPISIRVSVPKDYYGVILPVPGKATRREDVTVHEINVAEPDGNLHVSLVRKAAFCPASSYSVSSREKSLAKLAQALKEATHPAEIPLLRAAVARLHLKMECKHRAWEAYLALKRDYSSFDAEKFVFENEYEVQRTRALHDWIEAKARSPRFDESRRDFTRLIFQISPGDRKALARKTTAFRELHRSDEEEVYAAFVLCAAGIEQDKNLDEILSLAEKSQAGALAALKALKRIKIDKSKAAPLVLRHIPREGDTAGSEMEKKLGWAAIGVLRTFRSREAAPALLALLGRTRNSLIVQEITEGLREMKAPELFDEVAALARRSSDDLVWRYVRVLETADPQRAIPVLHEMIRKHPRRMPHFVRICAELGDRSVTGRTIEVYNTADDENAVGAAAVALHNLKSPAVFERLRYRSDMPAWIGERLVSVIREEGGGRHAFRFVEEFFQQHVADRGTSGDDSDPPGSMTCTRAFGKLRDRRALPYLREIAQTTRWKTEAVRAIGDILLYRRTEQAERTATGDFWKWMGKVHQLDTDRSEREKAIRKLVAAGVPAIAHITKYDEWFKYLVSPSAATLASPEHLGRLQKYLTRFGDVGIRHLLKLSVRCSLTARTNLARLMSMFQPETWPLLREAATKGTDLDQRKTAVLALGLCRHREAVPLLVQLLEEPSLRGAAIKALGKIGDARAVPALTKLRETLSAAPRPALREKVLIRVAEEALAALGDAKSRQARGAWREECRIMAENPGSSAGSE